MSCSASSTSFGPTITQTCTTSYAAWLGGAAIGATFYPSNPWVGAVLGALVLGMIADVALERWGWCS